MSLPNYVRLEDLEDRLPATHLRELGVPVAIRRVDGDWCRFIFIANIAGQEVESDLFRIRLPREDQLQSVSSLLEEYCNKWRIPFCH